MLRSFKKLTLKLASYFFVLGASFSLMANNIDKRSVPMDELIFMGLSGEGDADTTAIDESVLASGNWAKLRISTDGIYKISYEYLKDNGFVSSPVSSDNIGVFGQGSSTFSYSTAISRSRDIVENNILLQDGGDGLFGPGDYLLFYGQGPDNIYYKSGKIERERNVFSRYSHYFITLENGTSKSLETQETINPAKIKGETDYHTFVAYYERDLVNIGKSGRRLYGEAFEFTNSRSFQVAAKTPISGASLRVNITGASASVGGISTMKISLPNTDRSIGLPSIGGSSYTYASRFNQTYDISNFTGSSVNVGMILEKGTDKVGAWLDYIKVETETREVLGNGATYYSEPISADTGWNVLSGFINENSNYWLVNQAGAFCMLNRFTENGTSKVAVPSNTFNKVVEQNGAGFPTPVWQGKLANQNLHGIKNVDYIIIYPAVFGNAAARLADFHRSRGLDVETVLVDHIYNEFSSGSRHVIGIRDFLKSVYDKDPSKLKYALLFGDGSFINLDGFEGNTNFLPTYQSLDSENELASFVTDDFFGILGDNEGAGETETQSGLRRIQNSDMDIAIGRFPVSTVAQANTMVDKSIRYTTGPAEEIYGAWRNILSFVSDDSDGNGNANEDNHLKEANQIGDWISTSYPNFTIDKIFSDAYKQETTPGGSRYPAVNKLIKDRVQNGALLINYTGHGGEVGWAHERILDVGTINGWTNKYRMPIMVTATCEFSKFDDYERTSAGELALLNNNGGVAVLLSTTRVVYSSPNYQLNLDFIQQLFAHHDIGGTIRIGDVYKSAKVQYVNTGGSGSSTNHLNFSLLGDPALEIAMPRNKVVTTKINGMDFASFNDTIKALSLVSITGEIRDNNDQLLSDFNGTAEVKVLDKAVTLRTLGNDNPSLLIPFSTRNSLVYQGKATVENGEFTVQFIVPKDIQLKAGNGLIQYYAYSEETDANGGEGDVVIGGINNSPIADDRGPDISLFLNDESFFSGDRTGENSKLIAYLQDESGINTTGAGIGHDILAFVDNDIKNGVVLNTYYEATKDSYQSGAINYPFDGLPSGKHTLTLRAWDNNNNPAEASIEFLVLNSDEPFLDELLSYPNPATTHVDIRFSHNQGGYASKAYLEVYDYQGRQVAQKTWTLDTQAKGKAVYRWDLKNSNSGTINPGNYVYRVTLESADGKTTSATNKMLIVR